jgi:hypothetical protein
VSTGIVAGEPTPRFRVSDTASCMVSARQAATVCAVVQLHSRTMSSCTVMTEMASGCLSRSGRLDPHDEVLRRIRRAHQEGGTFGQAPLLQDRDYRIEGGTHVDSLYDTYPNKLRPILPCYRAAFDRLVDWVEDKVPPPDN